MSNDTPQSPKPSDDGLDMGEPIDGLSELQQNTSPSFIAIIRRKIHRRTIASQLISFSWQVPKMVSVELRVMLAQVLNSFSVRKGG